jgi:hypothetical protein
MKKGLLVLNELMNRGQILQKNGGQALQKHGGKS